MFIKKTRGFFVFCFFLSMIVGLLSLEAAEQDEAIMGLHPQLQEKARLFHSLHQGEELLILPNAWDALSAKIFEQEGAKAIATTSAGMAATFGYADGQKFPKELLFVMVDRIVKSVSVPVTVDLEAGFGDTVEEICETVSSILKIGAVGINIEDADPKRPGHLFSIAEQTEKIRAIKDLASKLNVPLFVNARTDVFWLNLGAREERLPETLARIQAYQEAGAEVSLFQVLLSLIQSLKLLKQSKYPLTYLQEPGLETWLH